MKNKIMYMFIVLSLICSCKGQDTKATKNLEIFASKILSGDTVLELGNNIMHVYQDKKNVYWFASWETGIYRFDGKTLINFTNKHGLQSNRIDEIKEDSFGNLYFNSGFPSSVITKFDAKSFSKLSASPTNEWKLQKNDLWFKNLCENTYLYRYDGLILHKLKVPNNPNYSNPFEIYSIYQDKKGNMWFGTNPLGVCRYNGKTFDWINEEDVTELHGGPANGVRSICQDKNDYLWFNTEYRYLAQDYVASNGLFYKREKSIGSLDGKSNGNIKEYLSICKDDDNNLWIATYLDGIWKYDGSKITHYQVKSDNKQIKIYSIFKDNQNNIWLGTHENGAYKFNGQIFEKFTLK